MDDILASGKPYRIPGYAGHVHGLKVRGCLWEKAEEERFYFLFSFDLTRPFETPIALLSIVYISSFG